MSRGAQRTTAAAYPRAGQRARAGTRRDSQEPTTERGPRFQSEPSEARSAAMRRISRSRIGPASSSDPILSASRSRPSAISGAMATSTSPFRMPASKRSAAEKTYAGKTTERRVALLDGIGLFT